MKQQERINRAQEQIKQGTGISVYFFDHTESGEKHWYWSAVREWLDAGEKPSDNDNGPWRSLDDCIVDAAITAGIWAEGM